MGVWYQSSRLLLDLLLICSAFVSVAGSTDSVGDGGGGVNGSVVLPGPLNQSFVFDGASSSDLAQQFYLLYARNDAVDHMSSSLVGVLPEAIRQRIEQFVNVSSAASTFEVFGALPGLLQRALVWDSGFVLDAKASKFVQIWTTEGRSMAEISITKAEIATVTAAVSKALQCTWTSCTQPNNVTAFKAFDCKCGDTVELLVKCAVASDVNVDDGDGSQNSETQSSLLWATGADPNAIPAPSITKYQCSDARETGSDNTTTQSSLWSIHTAGTDYLSCPLTRFDSLVIPCLRMNSSSATAATNVRLARMKEPKPSAWVDAWLKSTIELLPPPPRTSNSSNSTLVPEVREPTTGSSFKMVLLLPIVLGSLVVIALVGFFLIRRTGSSSNGGGQRGATTNSSIDVTALLSPNSKDYL